MRSAQPCCWRRVLAMTVPSSVAVLPPAVQVWSGASMQALAEAPGGAVVTAAAVASDVRSMPLLAISVAGVLGAGIALMLARLARELIRAQRLVGSALVLRRRGRARLLVSEGVDVPLSFWFPGRSVVLVPAAWLLRPTDLRMALRHEAQHHRQLGYASAVRTAGPACRVLVASGRALARASAARAAGAGVRRSRGRRMRIASRGVLPLLAAHRRRGSCVHRRSRRSGSWDGRAMRCSHVSRRRCIPGRAARAGRGRDRHRLRGHCAVRRCRRDGLADP